MGIMVSSLSKHGKILMAFVVDSDAAGGTVPVGDKAPVLFGANYPKLQRLKKLYHPEMIFSKWFPIHSKY